MNERIYLSSPDVGALEESAVIGAMRSGWIAPLGPEVDHFERDLAEATQRRHAVALSSGTAALHLALLSVGVSAGDVVLTSTLTFAATANAVAYTGAQAVFIDCDETGNLDPTLLAVAIDDQRSQGHHVAAIIPVDLLGKVANYPSIDQLAAEHQIPVISDAAESLGAYRETRSAGSFGVAAALSFNGNKIMTTSGGGAIVTDDESLAARVRYLATQARQPVVHYEHTDIGYNYRLSNLLAALGRVQLGRLPSMLEKRRQHRLHYRALFATTPGVSIFGGDDGSDDVFQGTRDNFWLTSILIDPELAGWSAQDLMKHLAGDTIEARPMWKPMHQQPIFSTATAYLNGHSDRFFEQGLSMPSSSALTDGQTRRVTESITGFLRQRGSA